MIPAEQYEPLLRVVFGMLAMRRGPHWQLQRVPAEATPFGEALDEAKLLADAIAGVMRHVPLPTRELGIVSDLGTLAIALYSTVGTRLALDRHIASERARAVAGARVPGGMREGVREAPAASEGTAGRGAAAELMGEIAGDGSPLRARVETDVAPDRVLSGDPIADGVQLGHSPTAELGPNEDPEPVLLEAFYPGSQPAKVGDLVEPGGEPLLERLAPVPQVDGEPAARELNG